MAELLFQSKEIKLSDETPVIISKVLGPIDGTTVRQFVDKLDMWVSKKIPYIIFNFEYTKYVNSTGTGILVKYADKLQEIGGDLILFSVAEKMIALFDMLGLLSVCKIYQTEEEAIASIEKRRNIASLEQVQYLPEIHQEPLLSNKKTFLEEKIIERNNIIVLKINGALDSKVVYEFQEKLDQIKQKGYSRVILDMERLIYINSDALGRMVNFADLMENCKGGVAIIKLHPKVKAVFEIVGVDSFFKIFANEEEAIAYLSKNMQPPNFSPIASPQEPEQNTNESIKISSCETSFYELADGFPVVAFKIFELPAADFLQKMQEKISEYAALGYAGMILIWMQEHSLSEQEKKEWQEYQETFPMFLMAMVDASLEQKIVQENFCVYATEEEAAKALFQDLLKKNKTLSVSTLEASSFNIPVVRLNLYGEWNTKTTSLLDEKISDFYQNGFRHFLIDFSGIASMNSVALENLLQFLGERSGQGVEIKVMNIPMEKGTSHAFSFFVTNYTEEALASIKKQPEISPIPYFSPLSKALALHSLAYLIDEMQSKVIAEYQDKDSWASQYYSAMLELIDSKRIAEALEKNQIALNPFQKWT